MAFLYHSAFLFSTSVCRVKSVETTKVNQERNSEDINSLEDAKRRKQSLETDKISSDNIYKILMNFENLFSLTNNQEKHRIIESLINKIEIHKNKKENGQWRKAIYFNIPLIKEDLNYGLDNLNTVETITLLSKLGSK